MSTEILYIITGVLLVGFILYHTLKKNLLEKESLIWLLVCIPILVFAFYPKSMIVISQWLGITYPPSLFFFVTIAVLFIIVLRLNIQLSKLKRQVTVLTQHVAINQAEIKQLKDKIHVDKN